MGTLLASRFRPLSRVSPLDKRRRSSTTIFPYLPRCRWPRSLEKGVWALIARKALFGLNFVLVGRRTVRFGWIAVLVKPFRFLLGSFDDAEPWVALIVSEFEHHINFFQRSSASLGVEEVHTWDNGEVADSEDDVGAVSQICEEVGCREDNDKVHQPVHGGSHCVRRASDA